MVYVANQTEMPCNFRVHGQVIVLKPNSYISVPEFEFHKQEKQIKSNSRLSYTRRKEDLSELDFVDLDAYKAKKIKEIKNTGSYMDRGQLEERHKKLIAFQKERKGVFAKEQRLKRLLGQGASVPARASTIGLTPKELRAVEAKLKIIKEVHSSVEEEIDQRVQSEILDPELSHLKNTEKSEPQGDPEKSELQSEPQSEPQGNSEKKTRGRRKKKEDTSD